MKKEQSDIFEGATPVQPEPAKPETAVAKRNETAPVTVKFGDTTIALPDEMKDEYMSTLSEFNSGIVTTLPKVKVAKESAQYYYEWDDENYMKSFQAVILYHTISRGYWQDKYEDGKNIPPTCSSSDCKVPDKWDGEKPISNSCATCPLAKFTKEKQGDGSFKNVGSLCKKRLNIFLLVPGQMTPVMLSMTASNIKPYSQYIKGITSQGVLPFLIMTKFALEKATVNGNPTSLFAGENTGYALPVSSQEELVTRFNEMKKRQAEYMEIMKGQVIELDEAEYEVEESYIPGEEVPF